MFIKRVWCLDFGGMNARPFGFGFALFDFELAWELSLFVEKGRFEW